MAIRRFSSTDSTKIWEHLNRLADDVDAALDLIPAQATGAVNFVAAAASPGGTVATVNLTFPADLFTSPPQVFAQPYGTASELRKWTTMVTARTTQGATIVITSNDTTRAFTSVPLMWHAVGN